MIRRSFLMSLVTLLTFPFKPRIVVKNWKGAKMLRVPMTVDFYDYEAQIVNQSIPTLFEKSR